MKIEPVEFEEQKHEADVALCRATIYSALALGFRPPNAETLRRLGSQDAIDGLADAAAILDGDGGTPLCESIQRLSGKARSVSDLSAAASRLFGHTARGKVSPYETEYGSEAIFQQAHDLGDLNGFYLAFGLILNVTEHERPDHISCECEFLSFLALKEAYALESGDPSMLEEVRHATPLFLRSHLARFVPAFSRELAIVEAESFYGALGGLCMEFVLQECRRWKVPLGHETLGLRPVTDDGVPMACGVGGECSAIPGVFDPATSDED